jgi:hypothetical protein
MYKCITPNDYIIQAYLENVQFLNLWTLPQSLTDILREYAYTFFEHYMNTYFWLSNNDANPICEKVLNIFSVDVQACVRTQVLTYRTSKLRNKDTLIRIWTTY